MGRKEYTEITNMCMLSDEKGRVLVQRRNDPNWGGITFPGGHVEQGESFLATLGFRDFRLRLRADGALLQVTAKQLPLAAERQREIGERLTPLLGEIQLDPEPRTPSV